VNKRFCLGTVQFGMDYGIANQFGQPSLERVTQIIDFALKQGVTFFDTAQAYGNSESLLGKAFQKLQWEKPLHLITKLHPEYRFDSYQSLESQVAGSLKRLNATSLWGLLLHRTEGFTSHWSSLTQAIHQLKESGLIQNFGVSVYDSEEALSFIAQDGIDLIQIPFNILDKRWIDKHFFEIATTYHKKIFIRSIYLQGLLLMSPEQIIEKKMGWALPYLQHVYEFMRTHHLSIKSFALQSILQTCPDTMLVMGVDCQKQLQDNLSLLEEPAIARETIQSWWNQVPDLPETLLNPSLWHTA